MKSPEKLVIVGGGLEGMLTGLFASRVKDAKGDPRYEITLLESKPLLGEGASKAFFRLHLGGEYPLDPETGTDCLRGAALWKLIFPIPGLFTEEGSMHFLLAKATHAAGLAGKAGTLTLDQYEDHYKGLRQEYEKLIDKITTVLTGSKDDHRLVPEVAEMLFGPSDHFMRSMTEEELKPYGGHMQGGFETCEPGLHLPRFMAAMESALARQGNIHIITGEKATSVEDTGHGYKVHCADGSSFEAGQVVQSAWAGGFELDGPLRSEQQHKKVRVYRRALAVVDTSMIPHDQMPPPSFVLKDEHGGMFSPINDNLAIVYHPVVAHLGEVELDSADPAKRNVPASWDRDLPAGEKETRLKDYKEALVNGPFPFLKNAKFKDLIIRPTLNFQENKDQRRHEKLEEIRPGYHAIFATKGTLALQSAIEAVEAVKARSVLNEHDVDTLLPRPQQDTALHAALNCREYDISSLLNLGDPVSFMHFVRAHDISASALPTWQPERTSFQKVTPPLVDEYMAQHWRTIVARPANDSAEHAFDAGFGPGGKVTVFEESGPKTGPVLDPLDAQNNRELCSHIHRWLAPTDPRHLSEVLPPKAMVRAIENYLLHTDMIGLMEEMVPVEALLSSKALGMLFASDKLKTFPRELWDRIRQDRPELSSFRDMIARQQRNPGSFAMDEEITAVMLPSLFMHLDEPQKEFVAREMVTHMHTLGSDKKLFAPLADENLNIPLAGKEAPMQARSIVNTGRVIRVNYQSADELHESGQSITYQGETYYPVEFHFQRSKNIDRRPDGSYTLAPALDITGKAEGAPGFALYKDAQHSELCAQKHEADPNDATVGELHAIYMHKNAQGQRRALALCSHVKLGEENKGLTPYIHTIAQHGALEKDTPLSLEGLAFQPSECFNHGSFTGGKPLPEAPYVSLAMGKVKLDSEGYLALSEGSSDIFYRGVHAIHLPSEDSVTISPSQLEALQRAQPEISPAMHASSVMPIQRAGGRRV